MKGVCCCLLLVFVVELEGKMVDMSHLLNKHTLVYPSLLNFTQKLFINSTVGRSKTMFVGYDVKFNEHTGTHMDVPIHTCPTGRALHELPKEQLVGPAVVFDVREQAKTDPDYGLKVSDIEDHERGYGRIPDGAIVFLKTGGSEVYPDAVKYFGSEKTWDFSSFHYPGFGADAVNWLIKERKIKGIGNDRLSFDVAQPDFLPVHTILGKSTIYGIENLANVHKIPVRGATVVVLPMAVEGGTGFPTRIMAFWGDNNELFYSTSERARGSVMVLAIGLVLTAYSLMN